MDASSGVAGILWWLGIAILFLVVIPIVVLLAHRLLGVIREIRRYADHVLDSGVAITNNLDPVPALLDTRELVRRVGSGVDAYVKATTQRLGGSA